MITSWQILSPFWILREHSVLLCRIQEMGPRCSESIRPPSTVTPSLASLERLSSSAHRPAGRAIFRPMSTLRVWRGPIVTAWLARQSQPAAPLPLVAVARTGGLTFGGMSMVT